MISDIKVKEAGSSRQVFGMGLKDGAIVSSKWIQANIMLGQAYMLFTGVETTPGTFQTSFVNTTPDTVCDVPDGTTIIPLKVAVYVEDFGTTEVAQSFTLVSKTLGVPSAGTVFVPRNVRTRAAGGSNCTCYTVDPTVTSGYTAGAFELCRGGSHTVADPTTSTDNTSAVNVQRDFIWTYGQDGFAPVIDGEGSVQTWIISQAAKGYVHFFWLEFATADLIS